MINDCWNFILFSEDDQNLSISTGNCCLTDVIFVSIGSSLLLRFLSPCLILCLRYTSKTIREQPLDKLEKVLHSALKKSSYVANIIFLVGIFRANAIKSITTLFKFESGISTGHSFSSRFFSSLASSDFSNFHSSPSLVRQNDVKTISCLRRSVISRLRSLK